MDLQESILTHLRSRLEPVVLENAGYNIHNGKHWQRSVTRLVTHTVIGIKNLSIDQTP